MGHCEPHLETIFEAQDSYTLMDIDWSFKTKMIHVSMYEGQEGLTVCLERDEIDRLIRALQSVMQRYDEE